MRKTVFLMSMLLILSTASVKAQVTIGSDQDPHEGAVLDLSQTAKLGLLLPRVSLENVNTWQIDGDEEKEAAIGMIVYNTNDNVVGGNGYGLYVWDGNVWTPVKSDSSFSNSIKVVSFDLTPSDISISIYVGGIRQFTIDNFIPEDATYKGVTWNIAGGKENVNLTVTSATACTIQGVSAGEATLQVSSIDQNVNKTITIKVIPITVKSFELDKSSLTLGSNGKTGTITAQNFIGSDDQPLNAATVKWSIEGSNDTGSTIFPATGNTTTVTSGSTVGSFTVRATADGISHDCTVTISDCSSVTDFEGNTYSAAKFGDAGCWMTQNLRSTKRSGNETLTENSDPENKNSNTYYHYPNKNNQISKEYGLLYTWAAANYGADAAESNDAFVGTVSTRQGICPTGWHLPSDYEWNQLEEVIALSAADTYSTTGPTAWNSEYTTTSGYRGEHGQKMKSATMVKDQSANGTSKSHDTGGFDVLLVGYIHDQAQSYGANVSFWSSSSANTSDAWRRTFTGEYSGVNRKTIAKYYLFSVRCKQNDN